MKSIALTAAVLCATATFSFGQQSAQQSTTPQASQRSQQSQQESRNDPKMAAADMPGEKMKCIREDMAGNQFEIQAGQVAQQRAQDGKVKELGQHLTQDHTKAQEQLQMAARGSDANASSSTELNPVQQAKLSELQQKQGEEFDRCFVFGMVADHEHDLLTYRWQAEHSKDAGIQKYAREQIPVLESHLKMARAAADAYLRDASARQAGEHMRGTNSLNNAASAGHDSHNFSAQPNTDGAGAPGGTGTDRTTHR